MMKIRYFFSYDKEEISFEEPVKGDIVVGSLVTQNPSEFYSKENLKLKFKMEPAPDITEIPQTAEPAVQKSEPSAVPEQKQNEPEISDQKASENSGEASEGSVEKDLAELKPTLTNDIQTTNVGVEKVDDKSEKTELVVEDVSKVESEDVVMKGGNDEVVKPASPKVTSEQPKGKRKSF